MVLDALQAALLHVLQSCNSTSSSAVKQTTSGGRKLVMISLILPLLMAFAAITVHMFVEADRYPQYYS